MRKIQPRTNSSHGHQPYFLEKLSLLTFILTAPFGDKIVGSLTIANVGQVFSFAMLVPVILPRLTKRYITYNWLGFAMMFLASAISTMRYNIPFHIMHISFFTLISWYISFFTMRVRQEPEFANAVIECFHLCAYLFIMPSVWLFYREIVVQRLWNVRFFFDDKSHTVIFFAFWAFFSLSAPSRTHVRFYDNFINCAISVAYFAIAMTTSSRLIIIFIPFYGVAFCWSFSRSDKAINRFGKRILAILLLVGIALIVSKNAEYFSVFRRLFHSEDSTGAHMLLIRYALQVKVGDALHLLLGIGPGNFGGVLLAKGFSTPGLRYDSGIMKWAAGDYLVVHSSHLQIFVDFSLIAFFYYVRFFVVIFRWLWKGKRVNEFLFFIAFIGAEIFYSTSNEGVFYMILLYLFAKAFAVSKSDDGRNIS